MKKLIVLLLTASTAAFAQITAPPVAIPAAGPTEISDEALAAMTAVLFNENDLDSIGLAGFYAEKRKIPEANLIGVKCSGREEITRREYDDTIAGPLREKFVERGWWKLHATEQDSGRVAETKIRFLAVMRGVPLKISKTTEPYEGDEIIGTPIEVSGQNAAAVDSELAALGLHTRQISGPLKNPYYRSSSSFHKSDMLSQLMVARLDGPTPADARRLVTDAIAAERTGLRGFAYVDARGLDAKDPAVAGLIEADSWLFTAADFLRREGIPTVLDNGPVIFPEPYPMRHCALYFGWYYDTMHGPFTQPGFHFVPGAIAAHIHSFSADTLRSTQLNWCGPFIASGAAATIGNVYEPYLYLTANLDVFAQRIAEGFTFAEAGQMSCRFISWMTTWVGDPLYRPFKFRVENKTDNSEWDASRDGVRAWVSSGSDARLAAAARKLNSGILFENLGLLHFKAGGHGDAIAAFQKARAAYKLPADKMRVAIHETAAIQAKNGNAAALAFVRQQIDGYDAAINVNILRLLERAFAPPKAAPPPRQLPPRKP